MVDTRSPHGRQSKTQHIDFKPGASPRPKGSWGTNRPDLGQTSGVSGASPRPIEDRKSSVKLGWDAGVCWSPAHVSGSIPLKAFVLRAHKGVWLAIWADRRVGENSEDAILRRKFNLEAAPTDTQDAPGSTDRRASPTGPGYHERRSNVHFVEGFEIFCHYKGMDYSAKATSGTWLLMNTGDLYGSLNRLSKAIGAQEDAWHGWRYRDKGGKVHPIAELRDESKITKRRRP